MSEKISLRSECIKFLRKKGTKVAIQVGFGGDYVYAEKTDFIQLILKDGSGRGEHLCDYNGNVEAASIENDTLHMPIGVS